MWSLYEIIHICTAVVDEGELVEHRSGIAEVTGSNPVEALIFFRLLLSNCLNWKKFTAMIILHLHLQPQYRYELFHINFTSLHCTGRYELNKLTSLPMCGFIAQLVEHRTGIAEVTGSNPVEALIFFRLLLSNCLNWKKFTAMIILHLHLQPQYRYELFHINFTIIFGKIESLWMFIIICRKFFCITKCNVLKKNINTGIRLVPFDSQSFNSPKTLLSMLGGKPKAFTSVSISLNLCW